MAVEAVRPNPFDNGPAPAPTCGSRILAALSRAWEAVKTFFAFLFCCACCRPRAIVPAPHPSAPAHDPQPAPAHPRVLVLDPPPPVPVPVNSVSNPQPAPAIPIGEEDFPIPYDDLDEIEKQLLDAQSDEDEAEVSQWLNAQPADRPALASRNESILKPVLSFKWKEIHEAFTFPPPEKLKHLPEQTSASIVDGFRTKWEKIFEGFGTGIIELTVEMQPKRWEISLNDPQLVEELFEQALLSYSILTNAISPCPLEFEHFEKYRPQLHALASLNQLSGGSLSDFSQNLPKIDRAFKFDLMPVFKPAFVLAYNKLTSITSLAQFPVLEKNRFQEILDSLAQKIGCDPIKLELDMDTSSDEKLAVATAAKEKLKREENDRALALQIQQLGRTPPRIPAAAAHAQPQTDDDAFMERTLRNIAAHRAQELPSYSPDLDFSDSDND